MGISKNLSFENHTLDAGSVGRLESVKFGDYRKTSLAWKPQEFSHNLQFSLAFWS